MMLFTCHISGYSCLRPVGAKGEAVYVPRTEGTCIDFVQTFRFSWKPWIVVKWEICINVLEIKI